MFSNKLKRPALALAVTAGLLAVAGPASAGTTNDPKGEPPTKTGSFFLDIGTTETLDLAVSIWAPGDGSDFVAGPASAVVTDNKQVNAPQGIGIDVGVVEELGEQAKLNTLGGDDSVEVWAPGDGSDF